MKKLKFFAALLLSATIIFSFSSCKTTYDEHSSFAMGSLFTVQIYSKNTDELWQSINTAITNADACLSATDEKSDISKINKDLSAEVSSYTVKIIEDCLIFANTVNKKADITLGAVTKLWGFTGETPSRPSDSAVKAALKTVGTEKVNVDEKTNTVSIEEGQYLDLGAFGKGAACDAAYEKLSVQECSALVSFGGTVLMYSNNPNREDGSWSIGIRNPNGTQNDWFATLSLTTDNTKHALFVSTSGSYEKAFEENGVKYHHLLNPNTGMPENNGLVSVTTVSTGGFISDGLSTACFINGLNDNTLSFLDVFEAEAVFVFDDSSYYVTDGLKQSFLLTDTDNFSEHSYEK